jgi:hypothetical protein
MTKEKIVFSKKSVNFLVKQIINKIDYQKLAEIAASLVPKPKDGKDGESLLLTEAIRADVINAAARLIPPPKDGKPGEPGPQGERGEDGSDYTLTRADQQEIVDIIQSAIKIPTVDDFINPVSDTFVSRSVFKNNVARLKQMISEAKGKRGATAGISGGEMVAEIDKAIGTDWRTGLGRFEAWITFDGTGVVSIYASENVSLLTDVAAGQYTITFENDLPDANYAVLGSSGRNDNVFASRIMSPTETNKSFVTIATYIGTGFSDTVYNSIAILR